jgi:arylformamidase
VTPLEVQYSPSSRVASLDDELQRYRDAGDRAVRLPHHVLPTGERPDEFVVLFDTTDAPAQRVHIFIHGGYWQALSAWDSLAPAPDCLAAGTAFAAVNYTLAPECDIETMIEQCTRAVEAIAERFPPVVMTLSGSSAGAHLAAHVALRRPDLVDRLLLASGIYDLTPLVNTYVNDALGLQHDDAVALSITGPRPAELSDCLVLIVHGDNETDAFKAQSAALGAAWAAPVVEVVGRHHFDLVFDLAAIDSHQQLWSTTTTSAVGVGAEAAGSATHHVPSAQPRAAHAVPARVAAGSLRRLARP